MAVMETQNPSGPISLNVLTIYQNPTATSPLFKDRQ
jgi:hypothetical protein